MTRLPDSKAAHWEEVGIEFKRGNTGPLIHYLRKCDGCIEPRLLRIIANIELRFMRQGLKGGAVPAFNKKLERFAARRRKWILGLDGQVGETACQIIAEFFEGKKKGNHFFIVEPAQTDRARGQQPVANWNEKGSIARYMVTRHPAGVEPSKLYLSLPKIVLQDAVNRYGLTETTLRRIWRSHSTTAIWAFVQNHKHGKKEFRPVTSVKMPSSKQLRDRLWNFD